jgi:hypothetical protein
MGKKFKITEDQLKRLVENKNRIQEQNEGDMDEEIDGPSKEEYFAKHGEDVMGWTGSSNKTYKDLPDGDYDDESYDDFDTLHAAHPKFHKHYAGNAGTDHARKVFDMYKNSRGPLRMKKVKHMDNKINEAVEKIKSQFKRFM